MREREESQLTTVRWSHPRVHRHVLRGYPVHVVAVSVLRAHPVHVRNARQLLLVIIQTWHLIWRTTFTALRVRESIVRISVTFHHPSPSSYSCSAADAVVVHGILMLRRRRRRRTRVLRGLHVGSGGPAVHTIVSRVAHVGTGRI